MFGDEFTHYAIYTIVYVELFESIPADVILLKK